MNRSRARISPITSAMIMYGVVFLGFVPPIGMVILIWAFFYQRRYRRAVLEGRCIRAEAARLKRRDAQLAAALKFSRS